MAVTVQGKYTFELKGLAQAHRALQKALKGLQIRAKGGVIEGALLIQRQSQLNTPIDTGNLKAGQFVVWDQRGGRTQARFRGKDAQKRKNEHTQAVGQVKAMVSKNKLFPEAIVGVSASYGIFVHEDTEQSSGVKFLEKAVRQTKPAVVAAIIKHERAFDRRVAMKAQQDAGGG